ncbi:MAG: Branched-chain amino acid transport system / permease component [Firmicutes bacterium ADurb.Bin182]|nr:MAG: Branched-chain amino acid transport system / permease component [Firmicutes bacterium ADurb.Bin182]
MNRRINLIVDLTKMLLIILIACVLVFIIVFLTSQEPADAVYSFFVGPFTSLRRIGNIVEAATPLMFTALAVIIIFRAGQFSMISEGAFFIGILGAMIVAITGRMPPGIHPLAAIVFGGFCGAFVASVPAVLKMMWGVSELVTSIMLNYVVQFFTIYVVSYHYREITSSSLASLLFQETSAMPVIVEGTRVHLGVIVALVLCFLGFLFLQRTRLGFKLRVTGDNLHFAQYAGVGAAGVMVSAQVLAGAIAGIGGGAELLGMYTRFKWTSSPGYGWIGIVVALLARRNPLLVPLAAAFIGYLNVGADIMARSSDVSREVVLIIQGVMMLLIASEALLQHWRQKLIVKAAEKEAKEGNDDAPPELPDASIGGNDIPYTGVDTPTPNSPDQEGL